MRYRNAVVVPFFLLLLAGLAVGYFVWMKDSSQIAENPFPVKEKAVRRWRQIDAGRSPSWARQVAVGNDLIRAVPHHLPAFDFDPSQAYRFDLACGSRFHGSMTFRIQEDGEVLVDRFGSPPWVEWESTMIILPAPALAELAAAIREMGILDLDKEYHAVTSEESKWVLRVRQGGRERISYFDQYFPREIQSVAVLLEELLVENGLRNATWQSVPGDDALQRQKELWNCIER
jgi:uncharacterized protein YneF (UPF0154 family)